MDARRPGPIPATTCGQEQVVVYPQELLSALQVMM